MLFRSVLLRALAPVGALYMGRDLIDGPWTETIHATVLTVCGGLTYGALRWRTASLWSVLLVHFVLAFVLDTTTVGGTVFPVLILCVTLGFVL